MDIEQTTLLNSLIDEFGGNKKFHNEFAKWKKSRNYRIKKYDYKRCLSFVNRNLEIIKKLIDVKSAIRDANILMTLDNKDYEQIAIFSIFEASVNYCFSKYEKYTNKNK